MQKIFTRKTGDIDKIEAAKLKSFGRHREEGEEFEPFLKMARATFEGWLSKKLVELNIDDEVFSPYIIDLLDGDDPEFEVKEGLSAILLSDILDDEVVIENTMKEILLKWSNHAEASNVDEVKDIDVGAELDISGKMHQIMEEARIASRAKKEKDKQDRENQKKQGEDRKKKAQQKVAKGERRA